tara:strand:- start:429 stop:791 length:363 start_codon:yes stop_codon:yes gene_type:complete
MAIDTSGQVTIRGESSATTTNLQQGLAKMFVLASDAAVVADSLNVSGSTDNATGDYSYTYTNNMNNSNTYPANFALLENNAGCCYQRQVDSDAVRTDVINGDGSANRDRQHGGIVHGDLA